MSKLYKYPRTLHLPWSPGLSSDDKVMDDLSCFEGREVVITEKIDGENTSLYPDHYHARSLDSKNHPSRNYVKQIWGSIRHDIPEGIRLSGENVYAKHSIHYTALPGYFLVFAVYNRMNMSLSWNDVQEWASLLDLPTVPVLYQGKWDEKVVKACFTGTSKYGGDQEGYVVRVADLFPWEEHHRYVAKFVRADHVQSSEHWLQEEIVPNLLAK